MPLPSTLGDFLLRGTWSQFETKKDEHSERSLKTKNEPVARVSAKHNNRTAENEFEDEAQGLKEIALFFRSAKVMLTVILWIRMGRAKGAAGEVVDVLRR